MKNITDKKRIIVLKSLNTDYSVTKLHRLPDEPEGEYITGTRVCILGIPIYDTTK